MINIGSRFDDRVATNPDNFAPDAKIAHFDTMPKSWVKELIPIFL